MLKRGKGSPVKHRTGLPALRESNQRVVLIIFLPQSMAENLVFLKQKLEPEQKMVIGEPCYRLDCVPSCPQNSNVEGLTICTSEYLEIGS